ncbi:MAG: V-type ATP synthase subunit A, partial [Candidatus Omnitrophica bacterium]|nr:V-type ATP synthase subunit A [Candidatus Omnitrophota bacterium]
MAKNLGKIISINGNMVSVELDDHIIQNEVAYALIGDKRLKSEVIKIEGNIAYLQVFEYTKGIKVGDTVEFSGKMLSVELGPGLLSQIYDGLQNPLPELAEKFGFFLPVGVELRAISLKKKWEFKPNVRKKDKVKAGSTLGHVHEGIFKHKIMVPFYLRGEYTVLD